MNQSLAVALDSVLKSIVLNASWCPDLDPRAGKGMSGMPAERCTKYMVMSTVSYCCECLSFYKGTIVSQDVNC